MPSLRTMFIIVAVVEGLYSVAGLFTPPDLIEPIFGWVLSPDGHWAIKLLGAALLSQALVAWVLRDRSLVAVAYVLAGYQFLSSLVDIVLWWMLADQGIFAAGAASWATASAIPLHAAIGLLLVLAAGREPAEPRPAA